MALLFVGGIMNIWWILAITLYVAVEKLAPGGGAAGAAFWRRADRVRVGVLALAVGPKGRLPVWLALG